jgi:hypothetical protein
MALRCELPRSSTWLIIEHVAAVAMVALLFVALIVGSVLLAKLSTPS